MGVVRCEVLVFGGMEPSLGSQDSRTRDGAASKIDGFPSERSKLAVTQTGVKGGRPQGLIPSGYCGKKSRGLLGRDDLYLPRPGGGQFQVMGRVDR